VTYVPEEYDTRRAPAAITVTPGQFGMVLPKRQTGRGVWIALLLIVASAVGFVGWQVLHSGGNAAAAGVSYTSAAGHFAVRFPAQPAELSRTERDGATRLVVHVAYVVGQGAVGEFEVRGTVHGNLDELGERLAGSIGSSGDIDLSSVKRFSFHGMRARQGNYISPTTGELMTALLAASSQRRAYLVIGLTGPTFDSLKDSFSVVK
jgi:hypothetical protein